MIETKIVIHWNTNTPVYDMQTIVGTLRAVLDHEVKKNTLGYKIEKMKIV